MELDYETVRRAIKGDYNAQTKLLNHFDVSWCSISEW